jgi:hypothetical protein
MADTDEIEADLESELSADDVRRRIDDWLHRLDELFGSIKTWATDQGWTFVQDAVPMYEQLMMDFNIGHRDQPSLRLVTTSNDLVWIKPKGLWVIGANGRIDIYSPKGAFVLVDVSEHFEPPRWILHHVGQGKGEDFTPDQIAQMV